MFCNIKFLSDIWFSKNYTLATGWGLVFVANILSTFKSGWYWTLISQNTSWSILQNSYKINFCTHLSFCGFAWRVHELNYILIACPKQCQPRANSVHKAMTLWHYVWQQAWHPTPDAGQWRWWQNDDTRTQISCAVLMCPYCRTPETVCSFPAFSRKHQ